MMSSNVKKLLTTYIPVILGAFIMIYPLIWMVASSFKPDNQIFMDTRLLPREVTFEHYIKGWQGVAGVGFLTYYKNTFFLIAMAIIGNEVSCSMTAYSFARFKFPLHNAMFAVMLVTMMIPAHAVLIPQYSIFYRLGWVNTYLPFIVPKFFAVDAFFVFLMIQFIRGLPKELDEAATVDGCNKFQIYIRLILPLCTPALVTTAIFTFIWTYNDFFSQMLYLSEPKNYTVSLGLKLFVDATAKSSYGQLFAMSTLSLVPVIAFFIFFQNLIIEGISTSGIKG